MSYMFRLNDTGIFYVINTVGLDDVLLLIKHFKIQRRGLY
jgi:hypothetical protein